MARCVAAAGRARALVAASGLSGAVPCRHPAGGMLLPATAAIVRRDSSVRPSRGLQKPATGALAICRRCNQSYIAGTEDPCMHGPNGYVQPQLSGIC